MRDLNSISREEEDIVIIWAYLLPVTHFLLRLQVVLAQVRSEVNCLDL